MFLLSFFFIETLTWTSVHDGHGWCFIGKAPEFCFFSYGAWELGSLVRAIVSAAVHGQTHWCTDFHGYGSLDIEMFEFILFSNAQIEISINWCMERGHMNLHTHRHHCRFLHFGFSSVNRDAKWKEPSWGGPLAPVMMKGQSPFWGEPPS